MKKVTTKKSVSVPGPVDVKQARIDAGLTQRAAAELVGITTRAWQYYEAGTTTIRLPTWRLFQALTVKPE